MKHIVLGFVVLFILPLVPRGWLRSYGRGFAVALLAVAVAQIFIGLTKLGREGHDLSDTAATCVLIFAAICAVVGTFFIFRKSRGT
jgi:quinol-cytochrome oxidoreductase complex cytochrome b subunit